MIRRGKRLWAALLVLCVLTAGILPVKADAQTYQQQMLQLYSGNPGNSAAIETCLNALEGSDAVQGAVWRQIMSDWDRLNRAGYASCRELEEGLAQDDSLCIVVFGYSLNSNGSMKPEMLDRLKVAVQAAQQYPNAYIAVTGGETAGIRGVSEAAVMAIWLMNNGIPDNRILLEKSALSTTENARNICAMLARDYPQVKQLAVVTSDYHSALAAVLLQTAAICSAAEGGQEMSVVAGASCYTGTSAGSSLSTQAWGIGMLTGTKWRTDSSASAVPAETEPETQPDYWDIWQAEEPVYEEDVF